MDDNANAMEAELAKAYTARRRRLMDQIGSGIALIGSPGMAPDPLYFDKNLFYLTGERSKEAYLLLAPQGMRVQRWETLRGPEVGRGRVVNEVLFVPEQTEREKLIAGLAPGMDFIRQSSGIDTVMPLTRLNEALHDNLIAEKTLWVNIPTCPNLDKPLSHDLAMLNRIKERFPWLEIDNVAPLIHEMRRVKEPYEIAFLRKAFEIHTAIYEEIMRTLKPGDNEALGEAIWHYEAKAHYDPQKVSSEALDLEAAHIIVAAGANTAVAHYMDNNQMVRDGDLVLIDAGIDYRGYSSDITRTFPANGRFTPRQRELYEIVLEAQRRAIATMKPGSTAREAHEAVYEVWKENGLDPYGFGSCGHPVGLNIHDATWDQDKPFEPGVVIVIEPFLSNMDEGIGIRTEDGVLITEDGHEMMPGPPKEVDEVEALCSGDQGPLS
jgi:Xaa-Pro aminopeptidase